MEGLSQELVVGGILLCLVACGMADVPERITVRDRDLDIVISIDDPEELQRFAELWTGRRVASEDLPDDYEFVLDIRQGQSSERWLYHSSGLTRVLSMKRVQTFAVSDPERLNVLLAAPAHGSQPVEGR